MSVVNNFFGHLRTITKHRHMVIKHCKKAGILWQGLRHDLSKYSPTEFIPGVKYYTGTKSPNEGERIDKGYSVAWLHHKGRNKHHPEYWYDPMSRNPMPVIPYKYIVEMICDNLAAGIVYNGKRWRNDTQLKYWNSRKDNMPLNEKNKSMVTEVFTQVSINGIEKTITKSNLKRLYKKYCE